VTVFKTIIGSGPAAVTGTKAKRATEFYLGRLASRVNREPEDLPEGGFAVFYGADGFPRRKRIK
jgi:hypothetical protein